ncbi:MAG: methyltransferase family protein [Chloroflexota bacterium]
MQKSYLRKTACTMRIQGITIGPFAIVRHPMYLGSMPAALGALLMYRTWAAPVMAVSMPGVLLPARREEQVLAAQFGQQWRDDAQRVPGPNSADSAVSPSFGVLTVVDSSDLSSPMRGTPGQQQSTLTCGRLWIGATEPPHLHLPELAVHSKPQPLLLSTRSPARLIAVLRPAH